MTVSDWFMEELKGKWRQGLPTSQLLHEQQSSFQHIQVFDTPGFGRMLVLDGKVQCTEKDEFTYHEMLSHLPLLTHPRPKKVLVVGGGDGGVVREVLKHPSVEQVTLVEIDAQVVDVCRQWFPTLAQGLQPDPRLRIIHADAAEVIGQVEAQDAILVDSSDPEGPSEVLFQQKFFEALRGALCPGGILAMQAGSPFFFARQVCAARDQLQQVFSHVRPYMVAIPTYPGGTWCLLSASSTLDPRCLGLDELKSRLHQRQLKLRYYSPEVHLGSLAIPPFVDEF